MSRSERVQELINKYVDKIATQEEMKELNRMLASDKNAAQIFVHTTKINSHLDDFFNEERAIELADIIACGPGPLKPTMHFRKREKKVSHSFLWRIGISIAACIALIAGLHYVNFEKIDQTPDRVRARLVEATSGVMILRSGKAIHAQAGIEIMLNDMIQTGQGDTAKLNYKGESTMINLKEQTTLKLWEENRAKRLDLTAGSIECKVYEQPPGKPMVITTPHAVADVFGTLFSLTVASPYTRLEVTQGSVRFTRISDNRPVHVGAGFYAVAGTGSELTIMPIEKISSPAITGPEASEIVLCEEFYPGGKIKQRGYKRNGKETGHWMGWWKNGQKRFETDYKNGDRNGYRTRYYENGRIMDKGEFRNDKKVGFWAFYYDNGIIEETCEYQDGERNGTWTYFHKNSRKSQEGTVVNGRKNGPWTQWHGKGTISAEGDFRNDQKHGKWTFFNKDGKRSTQGEYANGMQTGIWNRWYPNGQKRSQGLFKGDKQSGHWFFWYETGETMKQGEFRAGERVGQWVWWKKQGKIEQEVFYPDNEGDTE